MNWFNKSVRWCSAHKTQIATGISIVSELAALYFTGKGVLQAKLAVDKLKEENPEPEPKTVAKTVVPFLLPAAVLTAGSITCKVLAEVWGVKKQVALAGAYAVTTAALDQWKEETAKVIPEKINDIRDAVATKTEEKAPEVVEQVQKSPIPTVLSDGRIRTKETWHGHVFYITPVEASKIANYWNAIINGGSRVTFNDILRDLSGEEDDGGNGEGWDDTCSREPGQYIDISMCDSEIVDGVPTMLMRFRNEPIKF